MVEEAAANKSPEKSPHDDGTKVPLTCDAPAPTIEEAKYVVNPNGDSKIDVEIPPTFSGLTKEQLMKYSNDPFWIRLRWFLFIFFWLCWGAMLAVAIIIIIQAPGCKPPQLLWVEESPMLEMDPADLPTKEDLLNKMQVLGVSSVFFPNLISNINFEEMRYEAAAATAAQALIDAIVKADKKAVTTLPSSVDANNDFFANASSADLINADGTWNYDNEKLATSVYNEVTSYWIGKGVTGFLLESVADSKEEKKFMEDLNGLMEEKKGAVASNIVETNDELYPSDKFKEFLEDNSGEGNWSFFRFNPSVAGSSMSEDTLRLVTMGLFLVPGTPQLTQFDTLSNSTSNLINYLSSMKFLSGIQFGDTHFVNSSSDVVAYTRVYKGTPAYAVALNMNSNNETVNFKDTTNVGSDGTVEVHSKIESNLYETREKYDLTEVPLGPYEGMILQFVAAF